MRRSSSTSLVVAAACSFLAVSFVGTVGCSSDSSQPAVSGTGGKASGGAMVSGGASGSGGAVTGTGGAAVGSGGAKTGAGGSSVVTPTGGKTGEGGSGGTGVDGGGNGVASSGCGKSTAKPNRKTQQTISIGGTTR